MAIGHEQRQRHQPQDQQLQQGDKDRPELQQLEEGQELSPEQAAHVQPQLGNAALAALLARSASAQAADVGPEEESEELVEAQEEEELHGEELEAPLYGGGGGGGGGGAPADPWDMGRLFGGDDDGGWGDGTGANPRLQRSPLRPGDGPLDEDPPDDEHDPDAVEAEHHHRVDQAVPAPPPGAGPEPEGDAVHRAVERALQDPAAIARSSLSPEDLVLRGGPASPLGRPLAIGRFLAAHADRPMARALGRGLGTGGALLLVPATGAAGAAARLATMAVCAQAAEGGGQATDRAVALALATDAWPRAFVAARQLARKRRLHAPAIAARALGTPLSEQDPHRGAELSPDSLGGRALASVVPTWHRVHIPGLQAPAGDPVAEDEATAAVDALLAELTGGHDPRALPDDPVIDSAALQPVLDAASDLVNDLGRAQVELAAAGVAACRVRTDAPVLQALVHGDRALRLLAREVVAAGEALSTLRGAPRPGSQARAAPHLQVLRDTVDGLDALRTWVFATVAAAAIGPVQGAAPSAPPAAQAAAERARAGGDRIAARLLLDAALQAATDPAERRDLHLVLASAAMEAGDRSAALAHFGQAFALATGPAPDSWTVVAAGSPLAGLHLAAQEHARAREVAEPTLQAAETRHHWLAVADAAIVLAATDIAAGDLPAGVQRLLGTAIRLRVCGAQAAVQVLKARLAELRDAKGAARFDAALQQATAALAS